VVWEDGEGNLTSYPISKELQQRTKEPTVNFDFLQPTSSHTPRYLGSKHRE
jgi:hypothetical protein